MPLSIHSEGEEVSHLLNLLDPRFVASHLHSKFFIFIGRVLLLLFISIAEPKYEGFIHTFAPQLHFLWGMYSYSKYLPEFPIFGLYLLCLRNEQKMGFYVISMEILLNGEAIWGRSWESQLLFGIRASYFAYIFNSNADITAELSRMGFTLLENRAEIGFLRDFMEIWFNRGSIWGAL